MASFQGHRARLVGCAAIATLLLGSGVAANAATAGKHKPRAKAIVRTQTFKYTGGCGLSLGVVTATPGSCAAGASYNLVKKKGEKYLSITVTDGVSPSVPAILWEGSGVNAPNVAFCSTMKNFVMPQPNFSLDLIDGPDASCPGSATSGTIKVTFSSKPIK